ncbi:NEDD4-binding protein 2-like 2 [Centroberyx affinis]|uniref:NEDD4-binding protein 2-like 2 n=1 Tax=Centroberyx affinis TaxID=166261 RepID=UPI003A5BA89C
MSHDFSCTSSHYGEKTFVVDSLKKSQRPKDCGDESADKNTKQKRSDSSSVRERVLKDVGSTSTSFIGPPCRPETVTAKPDIEDTLSEFYKELEKTDSVDGTYQDAGFVQPSKHVTTPTSKEMLHTSLEKNGNMTGSSDTDSYQKGIEQKHPSWPHWYQNEPYHPRRPRSSMDPISGRAGPTQDHWRHPPPFNRPPYPRFQRPPYGHPPPPSAFPSPQDSFPHMNQHWRGSGRTNQYQEELHFPPVGRFPPPNECSHHFARDRQGYNYDTEPNVNVGWSANAHEGWSQHDSDWQQRADAENELREQQGQRQPADKAHVHDPSLVLILMRGLPGSGKSTRAKELLSTGPSGLILSTDDYFAHKDGYLYDPSLLGAAHEWNQSRAKEAMHQGRSPVIIDNTNIQPWEMKPYVQMALERRYTVHFNEPDTRWKFDPLELEKRNKHGVPQEKIAQMLDRFSSPISVDIVMSSHEPQRVNPRHRPEQRQMRRNKRHFR